MYNVNLFNSKVQFLYGFNYYPLEQNISFDNKKA